MSRQAPIRLTVSGSEALSVEVDAAPSEPLEPARAGEWSVAIPRSSEDRALTRWRYEVVVDGWRFEVVVEDARLATLRDRAARAAAEHRPTSGTTIQAQIPGRVTRVWVGEGEQVEQGHRLLAVEAMKMENEIRAPHAGRVASISVQAGSLVERDDVLLAIA